jgi:hypothetical protein
MGERQMKITDERVNQITNDRDLHMLIGHVVVLATGLKETQERLEVIEKRLKIAQTGSKPTEN